MPVLATFEEEELSRLYTEVATGGPTFETGIVGNEKGTQQRTVNRYDALRTFEIEFGGMSSDEKLRLEDFFITKFGRAIGFRFYPPSDREFLNDAIGVGDGTETTFYMKRNYRSRTRFVTRRIVKPVKHAVVVTVDGEKLRYNDPVLGLFYPEGDYPQFAGNSGVIDWDQGVIEFASAPAAGKVIRCAEGEYDIPVYFDVDSFSISDYGPFADWNSIKVVEILPSSLGAAGNDLTALSLAFTTPHSNETKSEYFDITLAHVGVTKVYLYLNGVLFGSDSSGPFSFASVPNPANSNESYRVTVLGVNNSGQVVEAGIDLFSETALVPDVTPPSVPAGLTITGVGSTSLTFTYLASTD